MRPDIDAIRKRHADVANYNAHRYGSRSEADYARRVISERSCEDVPALCARVEQLEAALRELTFGLDYDGPLGDVAAAAVASARAALEGA